MGVGCLAGLEVSQASGCDHLEQSGREFRGTVGGNSLVSESRPVASLAVRAEAEKLHGMADVGEPGLGRDLLGPQLNRLALDLDAATAVPAGQMVVMGVGAAAAVEGLAVRIPDGVDLAVLAQHLEVPVDGGQSNVLAAPPQLGVDLLGAAEAGEHVQSRR